MKRTLIKFAAIWGFWTLLAIIFAGASALYRINLGVAVNIWPTFRSVLLGYWIWAALTPVIFFLAKTFPFTRESWVRATALHFGFYLLLMLAHELIAQALEIP